MSHLDPLVEALRAVREVPEDPTRLATVTGTSPLRVQFDGEDAASPRNYTRLAAYSPTVGDRVLMIQAGTTWLALGKVV